MPKYNVKTNVAMKGEPKEDAIVQIQEAVPPTATQFGESFRGLFRWKRSFFQLIWKQAVIYYLISLTLTLVYLYVLDSESQARFELVTVYFSRFNNLPAQFLLGFFTSIALNRWFSTIQSMPGTSRVITVFIVSVKDKEDTVERQSRLEKLDQYIRYVLLAWILTFRVVNDSLRRKFPTLLEIQNAGFLTDKERRYLEAYKTNLPDKKSLALVVYDWLNMILREGAKSGDYFYGPSDLGRNLDAIQALKKSGGNIIKFASKNIPVALIQAVTITIYVYGVVSILGHQVLEKNNLTISMINAFFPLPYAVPYFLYYAWLKVGRIATDPFGDDADDIDVVKLFEANVESAWRLRRTFGHSVNSFLEIGVYPSERKTFLVQSDFS